MCLNLIDSTEMNQLAEIKRDEMKKMIVYLHRYEIFLFTTSYPDTRKVGILQGNIVLGFKVLLNSNFGTVTIESFFVRRSLQSVTAHRCHVGSARIGNLNKLIHFFFLFFFLLKKFLGFTFNAVIFLANSVYCQSNRRGSPVRAPYIPAIISWTFPDFMKIACVASTLRNGFQPSLKDWK